MDSAELIMNDNPERACQLMDSIDSHSIRSRALQARYALLYTESRYKNYIDETNDSLIMIAVRYYSIGNDYLSRFRSYYSLGCIYYELGQLSNAAVTLVKAEQLADNVDDGYRLGLLYTLLGEVYYYSYDFHRADQYYNMAMENYSKAGKEAHKMHALYDIGGCLMQFSEYDSAHSIFKDIKEWAEQNGEWNFASTCLLSQFSCSINLKDKIQAKTELEEFHKNYDKSHYLAEELSLFAKYYILTDSIEKANQFINNGWKASKTTSDTIKMWFSESLFEERIGNNDSALIKYKNTIRLQNQTIYKLLDQPVLGAQNDYFKALAEKEAINATHNRTMVVFMAILIILIITLFTIIYRIHKIRTEKERQDYLLTIKELRLKEDTNNEIINQLSSKVNALFSRQYAELDQVFEKMMETTDKIELQSTVKDEGKRESLYYKRLDEFYRHIKDKFDEITSDDSQRELDNIINSSCNGLMKRLADEGLNLSSQELLILRLSVTGFSPKTISRLTGTQSKTVYQQRSRTLQKIAAKSETLAAEIRKLLK